MATTITTESLLAAINEAILALEQAQEMLTSQSEELAEHKVANADGSNKGHVKLKDTKGDEDAAEGGTALTPKALKDFDTANSGVIINVRDMLRAEVEAVTGGRNTIIRDDAGNPHVMVVMPKFRLQDIDANLGSGVHPAFIVDGVEKPEIFIGKYEASKGTGNVPLTLPRKTPYGNITIDAAVSKCRALGSGFCCVTNAMWSARALYLWKYFGGSDSDHTYEGNLSGGMSTSKGYLTGTLIDQTVTLGATSSSANHTTLTGSGPVEWNDDGTAEGICDFVGNANEYLSGLRVAAGEIQIIPNNDAALSTTDLGDQSSAWKAILEDGTLVTPGTSGTLKYTVPDGTTEPELTDGISAYSDSSVINFKNMDAGSIVVPAILKQLALYPLADNMNGNFYFGGEGFADPCYVSRGGYYRVGNGPFTTAFYKSRAAHSLTFRVGYVA